MSTFIYAPDASLISVRYMLAYYVPMHDAGGQCYFITNGEPRNFWDVLDLILSETGCVGPTQQISFRVAYAFAYIMEVVVWLLGWVGRLFNLRPVITRHMVSTMACQAWFSHAKATAHFGYKPTVSLDDALDMTVNYFTRQVLR